MGFKDFFINKLPSGDVDKTVAEYIRMLEQNSPPAVDPSLGHYIPQIVYASSKIPQLEIEIGRLQAVQQELLLFLVEMLLEDEPMDKDKQKDLLCTLIGKLGRVSEIQ